MEHKLKTRKSCAWPIGWLLLIPAVAFPRSQPPPDCLTSEPEQKPHGSLLTPAMEKTKLFAQVVFKDKLKLLSLWKKKKTKLTTADIKMETGELCNFVCSVKY